MFTPPEMIRSARRDRAGTGIPPRRPSRGRRSCAAPRPCRRGLVRILVVGERRRGRPDVDGALDAGGALVAGLVEHMDLGARPGPPDRARPLQPLLRGDPRAAALGAPVRLVDDGPEPLDEAPLVDRRARRGRVQHVLEARQVGGVADLGRQLHEAVDHRRHDVGRGDVVLGGEAHPLLRRPLVHQDQWVADVHGDRGGDERTAVVQRAAHQVRPCALRHGHRRRCRRTGRASPARHPCRAPAHAFRSPGGARRVDHHVAERHPLDRVGRATVRQLGEVDEAVPTADAVAAERQAVSGAGHGGDDVGECRLGDHQPAVAVVEHVGDLVAGQVEVDRCEVQPGLDRRQVDDHELDAVADRRGDRVAGSQPELAQSVGQPVGLGDQRHARRRCVHRPR